MIAITIQKILDKETITHEERMELLAWFNSLQNAPKQIDSLFSGATSRITAVSQITPNLGVMTAGKFITPTSVATSTIPTELGFTGSFMSGNGETFGADTYNIGGVNAGALQWGASQTDGKLTAGAGSVLLGADGISLPDAGDAIELFDSYFNQHALISISQNPSFTYKSLRLQNFRPFNDTTIISNGDFETGDFTNWTETDPGGHISISASGSGYGNTGYAAHFQSATTSDYLSQTFAVASYGVVVRVRLKAVGTSNLIFIGGDQVTYDEIVDTGGEWKTFYAIVPGSTTSITIKVTQSTDAYLDDVKVWKLNNAISYSFFDVGAGSTELRTNSFTVSDLTSSLVPNTFLNLNLTAGGKIFVINEGGEDADTRMEGDTDQNLLRLDASTDRVGIGTATPGYKLDVAGDVNIVTGKTYKVNGSTVLSGTATGVTNGDSHDHNGGDGAAITEAAITLADNTTNNASTSNHGFLKKLSNVATQYMDGTGAWSTPAGGSTDGWTEVSDTWTYASASTINIPSDGTTKYRKYMKIRFKQGGGYKYFHCNAIAATLLTVIINTDYTVANAAITNIAYSFQDSPYGFPVEFAYTPTWTNLTVGDAPTNAGYYTIVNGVMVGHVGLDWGTTTAITGTGITASVPATASANYVVANYSMGIARMSIGGTPFQGTCVMGASGTAIGVTCIVTSAAYASNTSITSTVPATWGSTSDLEIQFTIVLAA